MRGSRSILLWPAVLVVSSPGGPGPTRRCGDSQRDQPAVPARSAADGQARRCRLAVLRRRGVLLDEPAAVGLALRAVRLAGEELRAHQVEEVAPHRPDA